MNSPVLYKRAPECRTTTPQITEIEATATMYEYVVAGNGVFLQARRPEFAATFPVARGRINGLAHLAAKVQLAGGLVPRELVEIMLQESLCAAGNRQAPPREVLFHLLYDTSECEWTLVTPEQIQTATSVKPVDDSPASSYAQAVIEVHSHHRMPAFFSEHDDRDEQGFRLYGVIGDLNREGQYPSLRLRVGVYGSFYEVPADWVFEMPDELDCVATAERQQADKGL